MDEDAIKKIKESIDLSRRTDFLNRAYLKESVSIVNQIITHPLFNNNQTINESDVEFTDYTYGARKIPSRQETIEENGDRLIDLSFNSDRKLSQILFDIYYPKATEESYYHYTTLSAFRNIVTGKLRLKQLITNENYSEFRTFYEDHNILGYFHNRDYDGTIMKDALMKEIYTFCMASKEGLTQKNEDSLWSSFADNGRGIRLEFEINTEHPDFRRIFYKEKTFDKRDLVINRLQAFVKNLYERELYVPGISKIGAFYLPGLYKIENEVRFVIKKHTDEYDFEFDDERGYLILPFQSKYAEFKLKKVKIGDECSEEARNQIKQLIIENDYSEDIIE